MSKRKERTFVQKTLPSAEKKPRKKDPYYNTAKCQRFLKSRKGIACKNMAYFVLPSGEYVCGQHSSKSKKERKKLVKDPNAKSNRALELKAHEKSVEREANVNRGSGVSGTLTCFRMKMMGSVPLIEGVRNVFPNNRHENREDGYGCCALSPMRLGPVKHRQPGLPAAKNIENYHQFNKVWPCELDGKGERTAEFAIARKRGYEDEEPHRHKFDDSVMKLMRKKVNGENRNQPSYSVHRDFDGKEKEFTYVQSRYFYCCAYEALAKKTEEFSILKKMLKDGYNLCICGYDAYAPTKDVYWHYCDPKRPFGHELVLYSLLTLNEKTSYPWHVYRAEHPDVYDGVTSVVCDEENEDSDRSESKDEIYDEDDAN